MGEGALMVLYAFSLHDTLSVRTNALFPLPFVPPPIPSLYIYRQASKQASKYARRKREKEGKKEGRKEREKEGRKEREK